MCLDTVLFTLKKKTIKNEVLPSIPIKCHSGTKKPVMAFKEAQPNMDESVHWIWLK